MSFILDALKKSEVDRQRQALPGFVDAGPLRPRQRLPGWALALGVLLIINLLLLVLALTRGWLVRAPVTAPSGTSVSTASRDGARPPEEPFSPLDAPTVYAPEIPVMPTAPAISANAPRPVHRADPQLASPTAPADSASSSADAEVLPTVNELSLTGAQALPELHLDVHVFATRPADRFVYINMRKYHEGETLAEGPTLERIRRDGVVLDYQGLRFLLPRQ